MDNSHCFAKARSEPERNEDLNILRSFVRPSVRVEFGIPFAKQAVRRGPFIVHIGGKTDLKINCPSPKRSKNIHGQIFSLIDHGPLQVEVFSHESYQ